MYVECGVEVEGRGGCGAQVTQRLCRDERCGGLISRGIKVEESVWREAAYHGGAGTVPTP